MYGIFFSCIRSNIFQLFVLNRGRQRLLEKVRNMGTSQGPCHLEWNLCKGCRFCSSGSVTGMVQYKTSNIMELRGAFMCGFLCYHFCSGGR